MSGLQEYLEARQRSALVTLGLMIGIVILFGLLCWVLDASHLSGVAEGRFIEKCVQQGGEAHRTSKDRNGNEQGPWVCQKITPAVVVDIPLDGG